MHLILWGVKNKLMYKYLDPQTMDNERTIFRNFSSWQTEKWIMINVQTIWFTMDLVTSHGSWACLYCGHSRRLETGQMKTYCGYPLTWQHPGWVAYVKRYLCLQQFKRNNFLEMNERILYLSDELLWGLLWTRNFYGICFHPWSHSTTKCLLKNLIYFCRIINIAFLNFTQTDMWLVLQ